MYCISSAKHVFDVGVQEGTRTSLASVSNYDYVEYNSDEEFNAFGIPNNPLSRDFELTIFNNHRLVMFHQDPITQRILPNLVKYCTVQKCLNRGNQYRIPSIRTRTPEWIVHVVQMFWFHCRDSHSHRRSFTFGDFEPDLNDLLCSVRDPETTYLLPGFCSFERSERRNCIFMNQL